MDNEKLLSSILEINKSLWKYWDGIQNLFKTDMSFLIREMTLCDKIIKKIIGYEHFEGNISSDPILNTLHDYCTNKKSKDKTIKELLQIEHFLKENKLYREYSFKNIIADIIYLYLNIQESENLMLKFFGAEESSLYEELIQIEKIINEIFQFESEYFDGELLIKFIKFQLIFNDFEELQNILVQTGKIIEKNRLI